MGYTHKAWIMKELALPCRSCTAERRASVTARPTCNLPALQPRPLVRSVSSLRTSTVLDRVEQKLASPTARVLALTLEPSRVERLAFRFHVSRTVHSYLRTVQLTRVYRTIENWCSEPRAQESSAPARRRPDEALARVGVCG